jgi:hypothetical protein
MQREVQDIKGQNNSDPVSILWKDRALPPQFHLQLYCFGTEIIIHLMTNDNGEKNAYLVRRDECKSIQSRYLGRPYSHEKKRTRNLQILRLLEGQLYAE